MSRQRQLTLDDYLGMARRRWWAILTPGVLGFAIALAVSFLLPPRYDSRSLILIDQQRVPDNFVQPVITVDINARLATIEEQVLSRTRLQPLIDKYGLFKTTGNDQPIADQTYQDTREAISVKPVQSLISDGKLSMPGFYIDFTYRDPRVAQQVCEELTSMFIDQDLRFREQAAQGTTNFLHSQLDDAKRKLDEQEASLAAFERKYMGELPDDTQSNLNVLNSLGTRLDSVMAALNRAQQDKVYTESLLQQQLQAWQTKPATGSPQPLTMEQQLAAMEAQLTSLEAQDTPQHPDVVRMKASIVELKKKIAQADANPKTSPSKKVDQSGSQEPMLIQQMRSQLEAENQAIEAAVKEQERINDQIKVYQSRIQMSPVVEQEYKEISRNHDTALQFYNSLLQKQNESQMASALQSQQEGEQFRVLDPPSLPQKPSFPDKPLIALQGLGAGLALGVGLVWLFEMRNETLRTEGDVRSLLLLPTLAMVPVIGASKKQRWWRRGLDKKGETAVTRGVTA